MDERKDIYILAIESSCDETAAAVVKNGREVLSMVTNTQIDIHKLYGGVVGNADEAVSALLSGSLVFDPDAKCSHHAHSHSEGEHHHACGGHCHH